MSSLAPDKQGAQPFFSRPIERRRTRLFPQGPLQRFPGYGSHRPAGERLPRRLLRVPGLPIPRQREVHENTMFRRSSFFTPACERQLMRRHALGVAHAARLCRSLLSLFFGGCGWPS